MSKTMTATELRANLYRVLDEVGATGKPCRIVRGGQAFVIDREPPRKKRRDLSKLKKRRLFKGSFEDLVNTSWESEWKPVL